MATRIPYITPQLRIIWTHLDIERSSTVPPTPPADVFIYSFGPRSSAKPVPAYRLTPAVFARFLHAAELAIAKTTTIAQRDTLWLAVADMIDALGKAHPGEPIPPFSADLPELPKLPAEPPVMDRTPNPYLQRSRQ